MIVFMDDIKYANNIEDDKVILNLSSCYSGLISITDLITKISLVNNTDMKINDFVYSPEFDFQYMTSIFSSTELFESFMRIMIYAHEGYNVIIMVARDEYRDVIMESLIKIIQERYGYNCWIVNDLEDTTCLKGSSFTTEGLITMDKDIKYYEELYQQGKVSAILNRDINVE